MKRRRKRFIKVADGSVVKPPSKSTAIELWRPRRTPWWDLRRFLPQPTYKTVETLYAELEATRLAQREAALRAQEILANPPAPPGLPHQPAIPLPPASSLEAPDLSGDPAPPVETPEPAGHMQASSPPTQDTAPQTPDVGEVDEGGRDDAAPPAGALPEGAVPTEDLSYEAVANLHIVYDLPEPLPPRRLASKR